MSLISKAISHLFGGVSQQAAPLRDQAQCELMENCWPDVAAGLGKRPPLVHVCKLNVDVTTNRKVHLIDRDGGEQYVVTLKSGELKVYDRLTGAEKTVSAPDGLGYISVTNPDADLALLTVADTTFVVNKTRLVTMESATDSAITPKTVHFVTIKTSVLSTSYRVMLPGLTASYSIGTGYVDTDAVAMALTATIDAHADYVAVRLGSTIKITRANAAAFTCTTEDGWGDQAMHTFYDTVLNTSDLPGNFWAGFVVKVSGGLESGRDDYYVRFVDEVWKETVRPGLQNRYSAVNLPHKLVRNADGTFTFSKNTWAAREVGDADSNPAASFVGKKINSVFFYRERLGFLSGEYVTMSRVSDYYNFWYATATGQLDDDPIDVAAADTRVSFLYHALPFNDTLLLFSDSAQFQLSGGDVLSASTVRLDPTTRFSASKTLPPTAAGRNVFFAVNKGAHSSLREYFVTPDGTYTDALDITAHAPTYVPKNPRVLEASSLTDSLIAVSSTVGNELFCYKFLWEGEKKVQSSWGKWTLDAGATVVAAMFSETLLALVVVRSDGTYVETINLQTGGEDVSMDRLVYLDRRMFFSGVYNSSTKLTTWTLPFPDSGNFEVVLGGGYGSRAGTKLNSTKVNTTTVTVLGDYSAFPCYVGKPYTMKYRFSEQFVRDKDNVAFQAARLQLRTMTVSFSDTGYFRMEVTPELRETYSYPYTARHLGGVSALIGSNPMVTGKHRFPIASNSKGLTIDLINDSPSPSFFQGAEWEGMLTYRAKRI